MSQSWRPTCRARASADAPVRERRGYVLRPVPCALERSVDDGGLLDATAPTNAEGVHRKRLDPFGRVTRPRVVPRHHGS